MPKTSHVTMGSFALKRSSVNKGQLTQSPVAKAPMTMRPPSASASSLPHGTNWASRPQTSGKSRRPPSGFPTSVWGQQSEALKAPQLPSPAGAHKLADAVPRLPDQESSYMSKRERILEEHPDLFEGLPWAQGPTRPEPGKRPQTCARQRPGSVGGSAFCEGNAS